MHSYVFDLKFSASPPLRKSEEDGQAWIRKCLDRTMGAMLERAREDETLAKGAPTCTLRSLLANTAYIVVNYVSVHTNSRNTAAIANVDHFAQRDFGKDENPGAIERSPMHGIVFYDSELNIHSASSIDRYGRPVAGLVNRWLGTWAPYLSPPARHEQFTLNEALLMHASAPRPVVISWEPPAPDSGNAKNLISTDFTTAGIELSTGTANRWLAGDFKPLPSRELLGLSDFKNVFMSMWTGSEPDQASALDINHRSIEGMLAKLVYYFGRLGGSTFVSIPVLVRAEKETRLRAVVSFAVPSSIPRHLYDGAWTFFSGLANSVIADLLVLEYTEWLRANWDDSRKQAVYFASHPIKASLINALGAAQRTNNDLADLARDISNNADIAKRVERIWIRANESRKKIAGSAAHLRLLNFYADLLQDWEEISKEILHEAAFNTHQDPEKRIALGEILTAACAEAGSKVPGVECGASFATELPHLSITRRLTGPKLKRRYDDEPMVLQAMFSELFENAATWGNPSNAKDRAATVHVHSEFNAERSQLFLRNAIHPMARDRQKPTDEFQPVSFDQASGLALAAKLFQLMHIGSLEGRAHQTANDDIEWTYRVSFWESAHVSTK